MIQPGDSTRLKAIIAEIKAILERENIAGFVAIHEPGAGEFVIKIDPDYSAAKFHEDEEGDIVGIEIAVSKEDIPNRDERVGKIENTLNMFQILTAIMGTHAAQFMDITEDFEDSVKKDYIIETISPEDESNDVEDGGFGIL
jgi:hypothetical protein